MPSDLRIEDLPAPGVPLDITIDDYGFTGEGFVRLQDGWLSVRGAMPGEHVVVTLDAHQRGGRRRFATLLEIRTPHAERRDPMCDQDAICRGCQLRHLSIQEEVSFKERALQEVLAKFSGWSLEELPPMTLIAPPAMVRSDGWRVRTMLNYTRRDASSYDLGLVSPGREQLVDMRDCPALGAPVKRLTQQVTNALDLLAQQEQLPSSAPPRHLIEEDLPSPDTQTVEQEERLDLLGIRIAAPAHGRGFIEFKQSPHAQISPEIFTLIEMLDETLPAHVSIFVQRGDQGYDRLRGPETMRLSLAGLTLELDPRDWFHATLEPAEVLYEQVAQWLDLQPGERFLDVGCGIGTLSLLAARHGLESLGIDAKLTSIHSATHNAERLGLQDRAQFMPGSWESALKKLLVRQERFDVATINPMREPLGERAIKCFNALGVQRLVYLGPSPAATARDLSVLRTSGWKIESLGGAMLHPATYHVMMVAHCTRPAT